MQLIVDVITLTKENFESSVFAENGGFWFVRFYAPVLHYFIRNV